MIIIMGMWKACAKIFSSITPTYNNIQHIGFDHLLLIVIDLGFWNQKIFSAAFLLFKNLILVLDFSA